MHNLRLKVLYRVIDDHFNTLITDTEEDPVLFGGDDSHVISYSDADYERLKTPIEYVHEEEEYNFIYESIRHWAWEYRFRRTTHRNCGDGLILGSRVCDFMYGHLINNRVALWTGVPYWDFDLSGDEPERVLGFQFMVEPPARVDEYSWVTIFSNDNNPINPPKVTPVPGEPDTYLNTSDPERVYRFLPSDYDLDQGYLLIYHRKFLLAIIEGFTRSGGFRRASEAGHRGKRQIRRHIARWR